MGKRNIMKIISNTYRNVIPSKAGIHALICRTGALRSCQLLIILLTLMLISCAKTSEDRKTETAGDSTDVVIIRPDQQIKNARISLYDGAVITTDLYADYIEKFEPYDSTQAWKLDVYFYDNEGNQISTLTA
ncbi:MAG: hypothetical protein GY865_04010, partial [candidate division Zixibacteria bacterium]|nr:hypothetical protein [candidate division Zixibacteria bacterium]